MGVGIVEINLMGPKYSPPPPTPIFRASADLLGTCPASLLLPGAGSPRGMRNEINCLVYLFCYLRVSVGDERQHCEH
jgi:hypothetical protein